MKTFIVVDNYGTQNNGVMAMGIALITRLRVHYPDCKIIFYSEYKYYEIDRNRYQPYGVEVRRLFWLLKVFPVKVTQPLISLFLILAAYLNMKCNVNVCSNVFRPFRNADAVLSVCGEDLLSDHCHWQLLLCEYFPFIISRIFSKPYIVFAQTVGPFNKKITRWLFSRMLNGAKLVTVRENVSLELLRSNFGEILERKKNVHLTGDIAFFVNPANDIKSADGVKSSFFPVRSEGKLLGISVSSLFANSVFQDINSQSERNESFINVLARFCDHSIEQYGVDIAFVPHVTVFYGDDRIIAKQISNKCKNQNRIHILHKEFTADVIKAYIGKCHYFIGCRMHALVAAVSQTIPTIALAYSYKTLGVVGKLINSDLTIDARKMTPADFEKSLLRAFDYMVTHSAEIRSQISSEMPKQHERSEENFSLLSQHI